MSRYIPQSVKFEVMLRACGCCEDCGTQVGQAELDHAFIPYSKGGPNEAWNLRVRCRRCNRRKGSKMSDLTVHVNGLWQHQQDVLTALDLYPFTGPLPADLKDCASIPIEPDLAGAVRHAALVWMVTAGGKTRTILAQAFKQLKRARMTMEAPLVLLIAHSDATVARFAAELEKVQSEDMPLITGEAAQTTIPTLSGTSAAVGFQTLQYGGVFAIGTQYLLNRISDIKNGKITAQWLANVVAIHIDEGAHYAAKTWATVASAFRNAHVVYWSGTPIRHDKELLPGTPYHKKLKKLGVSIEYELVDVAKAVGIPGARYPLAQANEDGRIKRIDPAPPINSAQYTDAIDPIAQDGSFKGENLEDLKAEAKARNLSVRPFRNDRAVAKLLEAAHLSFQDYVTRHQQPGMKLTVIVQAANTRDADRICRLARIVGWNAVVYYSPKEDDDEEDGPPIPSAAMDANLACFEDPASPVNMCIQVNCLTEGYDNASICMAIVACTMGSYARLQQFFGRVLRKTKGPRLPAVFWTLHVEPNRSMVDDYCATAVDLRFVVRQTGGEGPGEQKPEVPWHAEAYVYGDGLNWKQIAAGYDPLEQKLKADFGRFIQPEVWDEFKTTYAERHGMQASVAQKPVPDNFEEAVERYKRITGDLRSFCARNDEHLATKERRGIHGRVAQIVIHSFYPGLKGGVMKNYKVDPVDLARLLSDYDEDPTPLRTACLHKLRAWKQ